MDPSFSGDGQTAIDPPGTSSSCYAIRLQPDGKIVAVGATNNGTNSDFLVLRLNPDGSLDTSFDSDGFVVTDAGLGYNDLNALVLQPDGKILAGGYLQDGSDSFALVRYLANGALDTAFGTGGIASADVSGGSDDFIRGIALQPDGKMIAAGAGNFDVAVARFTSSGALDSTFDTDGKVLLDTGSDDYGYAVAIQPNGKILIGAEAGEKFGIWRFNPDGSADSLFGASGLVTHQAVSGTDTLRCLALTPDGGIVGAGSAYVSGTTQYDFGMIKVWQ